MGLQRAGLTQETRHTHINTHKYKSRDFPGGPVVNNPPSNARGMSSIPGQGTKIPCGQKTKTKQNIYIYRERESNKFNKKTLNMAHIKKFFNFFKLFNFFK